jgi:hypothetical protein
MYIPEDNAVNVLSNDGALPLAVTIIAFLLRINIFLAEVYNSPNSTDVELAPAVLCGAALPLGLAPLGITAVGGEVSLVTIGLTYDANVHVMHMYIHMHV